MNPTSAPLDPDRPTLRRRASISLVVVVVASVVVAACSASGSTSPAPAITPAATATPMPSVGGASAAPASATPASAAPSAGPVASPDDAGSGAGPMLTQPWATATLTDVATGETFQIADLAAEGRTVFVEMMAIWCTNCRRQQGEFTTALSRLDPASVEYVVLDIEPSETAEDLAAYRSAQGFMGRYAIAGEDVARALADEFGANALNPPTVPKVVIAPDGTVSFETGAESADAIMDRVGA